MNTRSALTFVALLLMVQAAALQFFGQPPICTCGYVKVWEGVVLSSGNSQHLTDWYTFSHIIHGFLFYALAWFLFPRWSMWQRLIFAVAIESTWEIVENTPWLIDHYRQQALAQGYIGDSIINSLSDTSAMIIGFLLAWRLPVLLIVGVALFLEVWVGYSIRDNLTLNIIGFFVQPEWLINWQMGK